MARRLLIAPFALLALLSACTSHKAATKATTTTIPSSSSSSSTAATGPAAPGPTCASTTTTVAGSAQGKDSAPPGDIPDTQAFFTFHSPSGAYSVEVPDGWARTDGSGVVTFTDKFNSIRIELRPAASAATLDSFQAAELPALRSEARCFEMGKLTTVTRKAGQAVLVTYRADSPADPVTGKVVRDDVERYELWRNGTEAVITLSAAQGSDNVDPWKRVTDSFAWT